MKICYNPKLKTLSRELRKDWIEKFEKKTQPPASPFIKGD